MNRRERQAAIVASVLVLLFASGTARHNDAQDRRLERQQWQIEQQLDQIGQLNRKVFDLPTIEQGPTGGQP